MRTFVIRARDITTSGEECSFEVRQAWLAEALAGSDLRAAGEGRVVVRASLSGRDMVVRGFVDASVAASCVRCLEPATVHLHGEIERLFVAPVPAPSGKRAGRGASKKNEEEEDDAEEVPDDVDSYDGETVVLDEAVREQILLEVPMNPLCREDCPGLGGAREGAETGKRKSLAVLASIVLPKKE